MPTYLCIIFQLAYICFMGWILGILMDNYSFSGGAAILFFIAFVVGWFIVWGICAKDNNETINEGIKGGLEFLKGWSFSILVTIGLAIALAIIAGMGHRYY